jgi:DsbC/DsbD-like thiol-disulfide interchange protein
MKKFILFLFGLWFLQTSSFAQEMNSFRSDYTQVKLRTNEESILAGMPFKIFLDFDLVEGWHTYTDPSGDAGLPVTITWTLPLGFKAGMIEWPPAETFNDGGFTTYGYSKKVSLPVTITPPASELPGTVTFKAAAHWLVCEKTCIPESAELALSLPVAVQSTSIKKQ